jgi:exopolysaccharide biosynthesis protein
MLKNIFVKLQFFLLALCIPIHVMGLSYSCLANDLFSSIHVLVVDPKEHEIAPVKALGRESVATLAQRYGACAAVNGGFWKKDGSPAGILKINFQWYGTPVKPRAAIGWSLKGQKVLIDRVLTNHPINECENEQSIEVIPVHSLAGTTSEEWRELEHIVGGTPLLVCGGQLVEDYILEQTLQSFLNYKHPRTAVGIKENGEWIFVVVDGRFNGLLGGMTIRELAELMKELGCVHALNLDGGGSSTMVLEGTVINRSCGRVSEEGKQVELVSDAILIFPIQP